MRSAELRNKFSRGGLIVRRDRIYEPLLGGPRLLGPRFRGQDLGGSSLKVDPIALRFQKAHTSHRDRKPSDKGSDRGNGWR